MKNKEKNRKLIFWGLIGLLLVSFLMYSKFTNESGYIIDNKASGFDTIPIIDWIDLIIPWIAFLSMIISGFGYKNKFTKISDFIVKTYPIILSNNKEKNNIKK